MFNPVYSSWFLHSISFLQVTSNKCCIHFGVADNRSVVYRLKWHLACFEGMVQVSGLTVCLRQFSVSNIILVYGNHNTSSVECLGHNLGCNKTLGLKVRSSRRDLIEMCIVNPSPSFITTRLLYVESYAFPVAFSCLISDLNKKNWRLCRLCLDLHL